MGIGSTINQFMDEWSRSSLYTSMPGIIIDSSEYGGKQFVDVKPAVSRLLASGEVVTNDEMVIYDVPLMMPGGGGGFLTFPDPIGQPVLLVFSMRNLEDFLYSDGTEEVIPGDSRHFNMTDAVAFPVFPTALNNAKPSTTDVELKFKQCSLKFKPDNTVEITNGGGKITVKPDGNVEIDPSSTLTILGNVEVQGTIHATQNISSDTDVLSSGISGKTHRHIGSPTAPTGAISNTGAPI